MAIDEGKTAAAWSVVGAAVVSARLSIGLDLVTDDEMTAIAILLQQPRLPAEFMAWADREKQDFLAQVSDE